MAEAVAGAKQARKPTEIRAIQMKDGRTVNFPGRRRVQKETLIDESKVVVEGDTITLQDGAVSVRLDFENGDTRTYPLRLNLLPRYAGHGAEQKFGDELALPADKAATTSTEDLVMAVDDLHQQVNEAGNWSAVREGGGGFSGAHVVIQAIIEAKAAEGQTVTVDQVKAYFQKKLDQAKADGKKLSRKELYDGFRDPTTKVGKIVQRLEQEKLAAAAKFDADEELDGIAA